MRLGCPNMGVVQLGSDMQDNDSAEATCLGIRAAEIAEKARGADHPDTKQYKEDWC